MNEDRVRRERERQFGRLAAFVRHLPCLVCGGYPSEAAHVRARRMWGAWLPDGAGNIVPLCHGCHAEQHRIGVISFQAVHSIDLAGAAREAGMWFNACEGADG